MMMEMVVVIIIRVVVVVVVEASLFCFLPRKVMLEAFARSV